MSKENPAREEIFARVRSALKPVPASPLSPLPPSARFAPRRAEALEKEIERMLREVERLSGLTRKVRGREEFAGAFGKLVKDEGVRTAVLSDHPLYREYGLKDLLQGLEVEILPPDSSRKRIAGCDLGITVADAALPETGTSLLRTTQGQPDFMSLLPRVHLVLVPPEALLADIHQAFSLAKDDRHFVLVSGCSRTADIEKVLTLGVHGPKSFHVWICS
ncbi:MAG TPA: LUD domain-containing protein [Syntrophales bacterium]|nr:LUD domain-containing protein [Syntrophales bacterium]HOX93813.1 LUD domain-containing protein [Syntrophales bacterium]HPI57746.1 LUD domain-containing protein [Syntrophales bacterium]HPN25844.1 LUD domain-containing protein [Syntrophales bacterium]HQM30364.1 LUD domain-containing protein [Syntrophales bacterium]